MMNTAQTKLYEGIDFALKKENVGHCYLRDDGQCLELIENGSSLGPVTRAAVDCPLGTTTGFQKLLVGELPDESKDGFQLRQTETWLRKLQTDYNTNQHWRLRSPEDRQRYPHASYFNGAQHVQPTLGLRMVPACLYWLAQRLSPLSSTNERKQLLESARRGEGPIVEAHPRPFLYSAVERIFREDPSSLPLERLNHVANYKKFRESRREVYTLLRDHQAWMGNARRNLLPNQLPQLLESSDHAFDAWLCALTAWAHNHGETISWSDVPTLARGDIEIEGHILVLSTVDGDT